MNDLVIKSTLQDLKDERNSKKIFNILLTQIANLQFLRPVSIAYLCTLLRFCPDVTQKGNYKCDKKLSYKCCILTYLVKYKLHIIKHGLDYYMIIIIQPKILVRQNILKCSTNDKVIKGGIFKLISIFTRYTNPLKYISNFWGNKRLIACSEGKALIPSHRQL